VILLLNIGRYFFQDSNSNPNIQIATTGAIATAAGGGSDLNTSKISDTFEQSAKMDEKYFGFMLALLSTIFIGTSFVVKKMGLLQSDGHGTGVSNLSCLKSPVWWVGTISMGLGEFANFAAYSFAPAILVTPIGALSVAISAVLASVFLNEKLDTYGKVGCGLCILGSTIIVIHAPSEQEIHSVNEILFLMSKPSFVTYSLFVAIYTAFTLWKIAPRYGKRNMLIYISICSFVGSLLVISVKGLGIAIKLTIQGDNQFTQGSAYFFIISVIIESVFQLNYLNLALDLFSTAAVSPVYYVFFTSATLTANALLFGGFEGQTIASVVNGFLGFVIMVAGVFLLYSPTHDRGGLVGDLEMTDLSQR